MEYLYIINPEKYNGNVLNTMPSVEAEKINSTNVHYMGKTSFEQYNKENGGNLLALKFDDYFYKFRKPYENDLQGDFQEITEEQFFEGLECLPPVRWNRKKGFEYFYISEATTGSLHDLYVRKCKKYYSALRCINLPNEKIEKQINRL